MPLASRVLLAAPLSLVPVASVPFPVAAAQRHAPLAGSVQEVPGAGALSGPANRSVEAWFKTTSATDMPTVAYGPPGVANQYFGVYVNGTAIEVKAGAGTTITFPAARRCTMEPGTTSSSPTTRERRPAISWSTSIESTSERRRQSLPHSTRHRTPRDSEPARMRSRHSSTTVSTKSRSTRPCCRQPGQRPLQGRHRDLTSVSLPQRWGGERSVKMLGGVVTPQTRLEPGMTAQWSG